jgi:AraC family transcriptional regulator
MALPLVPVTHKSPRFHSQAIDGYTVIDAWFPPGTWIEPHVHERACFAIMLSGSFDLAFRRRTFSCTASSVFVEPCGERHSNRVANGGAHVVVVQPDPACQELWAPFATLLDGIRFLQHGGVRQLAGRLGAELRAPDCYSGVAIESLITQMFIETGRDNRADDKAPPRWLLRARDLLHDLHGRAPRISEIARTVGVHPTRLSRSFRRFYRVSIGSYSRQLRLDSAIERLIGSADSIASIAADAGFSDQSHFTRLLKRYSGRTPDQIRRPRHWGIDA